MDRNREARRVAMTTAGNGLSRRRHRVGSFRDSPEDEGPVDLPEAARLRDRGGNSSTSSIWPYRHHILSPRPKATTAKHLEESDVESTKS
ncbi:unnamed protein product [Cochlearia groenlandica]